MSKKAVGGDYLLDLSSIEIEKSEDGTKTNITDADVLAQLTNLKKYVKNPEMAKPVWVKLLNGENDELVIARGTFAVIDTGEFEICVQLDGYKLIIYIEFTQVTLEDSTPIDDWFIDTNDAKYLFTSDAQNVKATIEDENFGNVALAGNLSVGGDLSVTGKINNESNPSLKPIYWHNVKFSRNWGVQNVSQTLGYMIILNNSATPIDATSFTSLIESDGFIAEVLHGFYILDDASKIWKISTMKKSATPNYFDLSLYDDSANISGASHSITGFVIEDLGVNKIN